MFDENIQTIIFSFFSFLAWRIPPPPPMPHVFAEHECNIIPLESAVGTFRISQPGSSVATSLTAGESERKQVGILDVRGNDYRLRPIPLSQVRSFVAADISLKENENVALDPEDPDIDEAMGVLLADRVTELVEEARNQAEILRQDASVEAAKSIGGHNIPKMKYSLIEPNQVLVRLKVEHSGFSTLNNQRFGSRFVGEVVSRGGGLQRLVCCCATQYSGFALCINMI